jgi:Zn ribbon nucleic-acid-binding protein
MSTKNIVILTVGIVFIIGASIVFFSKKGEEVKGAELETFAQCITEKGAIFYGAFWCPACQTQKRAFGNAEKYVEYVECASTNQNEEQNQVCTDAGITNYPTWTFEGGEERLIGLRSIEELSLKTGCPLPS